MKSLPTLIHSTALAMLALSLAAPAGAQPRRPAPEPLMGGPWELETEGGPVRVSILTNDLESPWSLAFLPDGDMLLTERPGRLRVVR
ncbi:MAG TPA: PQQ-dependent sugar dehydrogenase, partial [Gammaproteobacteria bacterium]